MNLHTTLGIAKTGTNSLRVTVPEGVVAYLALAPGDKLEWRMEVENGEKVVFVGKSGKQGKDSVKFFRSTRKSHAKRPGENRISRRRCPYDR